jgi:protein SCO1/2
MRRVLAVVLLGVSGLVCARVEAPEFDASSLSFRERPGATLPLDALFRDADAREVRIGELSHGLPLIVVLGYFKCSRLCGVVRASLFKALAGSGLRSGRDYALAAFSIDPQETSTDARAAMAQDMSTFTIAANMRYLTGTQREIRAIADAVGFRARPDPATRQFAHPAGIVFITPDGIVSSYLLGVGYAASAVRLGVRRAAARSVVAAAASPILLICFHFDPLTGRYSLEILKLLRLGAILTMATIGGVLYLLFRRERSAT